MFGWDFEDDTWSRFWTWNLIKICVWTCDKNSTLGSVVPLAMFRINMPTKSSPRTFTFKSNSLWRRWWGSRLPHTWRNHPTRSPHSCRPFDQVIHFFLYPTGNFISNFEAFWNLCFSPSILGLCFFTQEHDWHTGHQCTMISKTPNNLLLLSHYTTGQALSVFGMNTEKEMNISVV